MCFAGLLLVSPGIVAAVEDLDEITARQSRLPTATWGPNYVEDASNGYKWQPETLMYHDVNTGHEVWKMTSTNNRDNFYHNDISWGHWSADGKWLAFATTRDTNAFSKTTGRIWMVVQTNGADMMPITGASNRGYNGNHEYFHWSPQLPDVYYDTGDHENGLNTSPYSVYKNTVSTNGVTHQLLFSTNQGNGNSKTKKLSKTISGDGKKILLRDSYVASGPHYLYPCTVYPENEAGCSDWDGYSIDRGQGSGYDVMPESYTREHGGGLFLTGNDQTGYYTYLNPTGTQAWWKMPITGSAPDGGPLYSNNGVSGEVVIMSTAVPNFPPWENHFYWSHVSLDMWGTHAVFSNGDDVQNPGTSHINTVTHEYDSLSFIRDYGTQHQDWHGFTDYTVTSYNPRFKPDGLGMRITAQRYNDTTTTDIRTVAFTHTRELGGTAYSTVPRPFISPDGTKVAWTSEFLNGSANNNDIYWSVIFYPKPPINLAATRDQGNVRLSWERPAYTTRGWPNETLDAPPKSKEIKGYHVWVSNNGSTGWNEITSGAINGEQFNVAQSTNTTRYYAITSEEYSRLESDKLSEVIQVTVDGAGSVSYNQHAPEGITGFWTTAPSTPSSFSVASQGTQGHYRLNWSEPSDSKIRYYNIYYSSVGEPATDQQHRIASVPVGTSTYLDWNADPARTGYYKITSVDRHGNEGGAVALIRPNAPTIRFN